MDGTVAVTTQSIGLEVKQQEKERQEGKMNRLIPKHGSKVQNNCGKEYSLTLSYTWEDVEKFRDESQHVKPSLLERIINEYECAIEEGSLDKLNSSSENVCCNQVECSEESTDQQFEGCHEGTSSNEHNDNDHGSYYSITSSYTWEEVEKFDDESRRIEPWLEILWNEVGVGSFDESNDSHDDYNDNAVVEDHLSNDEISDHDDDLSDGSVSLRNDNGIIDQLELVTDEFTYRKKSYDDTSDDKDNDKDAIDEHHMSNDKIFVGECKLSNFGSVIYRDNIGINAESETFTEDQSDHKNNETSDEDGYADNVDNATKDEDRNGKFLVRYINGEKPYKCEICKKTLTDNSGLRRHMRIHTGEKPYKCEICEKSFRQSGHLHMHKMLHSGEKPYHCKFCQKAFIRSFDLKLHIRVHTGEKPYQCKVCWKEFIQSCDLKKHMRVHSDEKPYQCKICKKKFKNSSNMNVHLRTHSGEKAYECKLCEKKFTHNSSLKVHMTVHTGEKPYQCTVCKKLFAQNGDMKRHMRIHSGEKPYQCTMCKKAFNNSSSRKNHLRTHDL